MDKWLQPKRSPIISFQTYRLRFGGSIQFKFAQGKGTATKDGSKYGNLSKGATYTQLPSNHAVKGGPQTAILNQIHPAAEAAVFYNLVDLPNWNQKHLLSLCPLDWLHFSVANKQLHWNLALATLPWQHRSEAGKWTSQKAQQSRIPRQVLQAHVSSAKHKSWASEQHCSAGNSSKLRIEKFQQLAFWHHRHNQCLAERIRHTRMPSAASQSTSAVRHQTHVAAIAARANATVRAMQSPDSWPLVAG